MIKPRLVAEHHRLLSIPELARLKTKYLLNCLGHLSLCKINKFCLYLLYFGASLGCISLPFLGSAQVIEQSFDDMSFIKIQGQSFTFGSATDYTLQLNTEAHRVVHLSHEFWIGKYEVTQSQWVSVMGSNPSHERALGPIQSLPVDHVSWYDAQSFIEKLNEAAGGLYYRLPTEAEWEYVAKAGSQEPWFFGSLGDLLSIYAHRDQYLPVTIGVKLPNPWGVHDLYGNVYEWCADWYRSILPKSQGICPPKTGQYKVLRGGSNACTDRYLRSSSRQFAKPERKGAFIGLRLVRVSDPSQDPFSDLQQCNQLAFCGDQVRSNQEECDDGNLFSGDGCSASCLIEEDCSTNLCSDIEEITLSGEVLNHLGQITTPATLTFTLSNGESIQTTTEADGTFEILLPASNYESLEVNGYHTLNQHQGFHLSNNTHLQVVLPELEVNLEIFDDQGQQLTSVLVESLVTEPTAVSNLVIKDNISMGPSLLRQQGSTQEEAFNGIYSFHLFKEIETTFKVTQHDDFGQELTTLHQLTVPADASSGSTYQITLPPPPVVVTVSGRFSHHNQGIKQAKVTFHPTDSLAISTTTDDLGFYEVDLPVGLYQGIEMQGFHPEGISCIVPAFHQGEPQQFVINQETTISCDVNSEEISVTLILPNGQPGSDLVVESEVSTHGIAHHTQIETSLGLSLYTLVKQTNYAVTDINGQVSIPIFKQAVCAKRNQADALCSGSELTQFLVDVEERTDFGSTIEEIYIADQNEITIQLNPPE